MRVIGYLQYNNKRLMTDYKNMVIKFAANICTAFNGLFAYDKENNSCRLIPYDEIYYIETIKGTHYCIIYHKNGVCQIKAEINNLVKYLPFAFCKCRSSTIANLRYVIKIDFSNAMMYFTKDIACTYSIKNKSAVKRQFEVIGCLI